MSAYPDYSSNPTLYVGDLAPDVTDQYLFDMFNRIAQVLSVRICRDASSRKSLGYGYVNFQRQEDADLALERLNFERVRGRPCRIAKSNRDPQKRKAGLGNLFVKGLPEDTDSKTLYDVMSAFGAIDSLKVPYKEESVTGSLKCRGYGFVQFSSVEVADKLLVDLNSQIKAPIEVLGKAVQVEKFKPRNLRQNQIKTNVIIKNLPPSCDLQQFEALYSRFGKAKVLPQSSAPCVKLVYDEEQGVCKGYGFVDFESPESAQRCVIELDGSKPAAAAATDDISPGPQAFIHKSKSALNRERQLMRNSSPPVNRYPNGQNLYLKNLADDVTDATLMEEFSKFGGRIISAKVKVHQETKASLGHGFVCFSTPQEAEAAFNEIKSKTPYYFRTKPLYIAFAQTKNERQEFLRMQRSQIPGVYAPTSFAPSYPYPPRIGDPMSYYPGAQSTLVRATNQGVPYTSGGGRGGYNEPRLPFQQPPVAYPVQRRGPNTNPNPTDGPRPFPRGENRQARLGQGGFPRENRVQVQNSGPWPAANPVQTRGPVVGGGGGPQQSQNPPQVPQRVPILNAQDIARMSPEQAKRMIGENMYPAISSMLDGPNKSRAGKITGMLLEALDAAELLNLLEDKRALEDKLNEALRVLNEAENQPVAAQPQS